MDKDQVDVVDQVEEENAETEPEVVLVDETEKSDSEIEAKAEEDKATKNTFQNRINDLTRKRRESERRELEAMRRITELETTLANVQANTSNQEATTLESQIEALQSARKKALEDGDYDSEEKINDRIIDSKIRQQQAKQIAQYADQAKKVAAQPPSVDPRAYQFIQSNQDWFNVDADKTKFAYQEDAKLKSEGWDPRTEEFWAELDSRVAEYGVANSAVEQQVAQPVARPTSTPRKAARRNQIRVTAEEQEMLKQLKIAPGTPAWDRYIQERKRGMAQ